MAHAGGADAEDHDADDAQAPAAGHGQRVVPFGTAEEAERDEDEKGRFHVEDDPCGVVTSAVDLVRRHGRLR